ncbi:hypothetical protein SAMN05421749_10114 [Acinetobacter marinus]|uniref:Uncharacterized protein n=1 Tax=Acinetobacter marinus TaxID=281375 RepID=A0A1G6GIH8_9GAMM|nr:hypothetical protein [Acinetobacter marinus]SDB81719.1 hypothetical protein SAMN05421749_10114 [Acinetobacter marinus]
MSKYLLFIKENLSLIILIPTILGGIYQVLNILTIIGLPYIRFFSISQVVPDGLMILVSLCVSLLIFFIFKFYINGYFNKRNGKIDQVFRNTLKTSLMYIIGSLIFISLLFVGKYFFYPKNISFAEDKIFTYVIILFLLFSFNIMIHNVIILFNCIGVSLGNISNSFKAKFEVLLTFFAIIFVILLMREIVSWNNYINHLDNFSNIEVFSKKYGNSAKFLYMNRDYAFYEITNDQGNAQILVVEAKDLMSLKLNK